MNSYTFTNCKSTGNTGPTQSQADTEYSSTSLGNSVTVTDGIQYWTVPNDGIYSIEAAGAGINYFDYQKGAIMSGEFELKKGAILKILVGQIAVNNSAGSGGTFVSTSNNIPVIVAGGAGGAWANDSKSRGEISRLAVKGSQNGNDLEGEGGLCNGCNGQGGGGFYSNGTNGSGKGMAFINGGKGGPTSSSVGGFGGGGSSLSPTSKARAGGGGGYSGGNGSSLATAVATGGGSYNSGWNQKNSVGARAGHGYVIITQLITNEPPSQPGSFIKQPAPTSVNLTEENIELTWGTSTDPENDTVTYTLEFYNGSVWNVIASNLSELVYSYKLPTLDTENAQFRVKAVDNNDGESEYRTSNIFTVRRFMLLIRDGYKIKSLKNGSIYEI